MPPKVAAAEWRGGAPGIERLAALGERRPDPRVLDRGGAGRVEHRPHPPRPDDGPESEVRQDQVRRLRLPRLHRRLQVAAGAGDGAGAADRSRSRRHRRRPLPQQAEGAGDDAPARDLLRERDGRRLQGQVDRPRRLRPDQPHLHLRLGGAGRDRRQLALPRPRADGPAADLQGAVRAAGGPRPRRGPPRGRVLPRLPHLGPLDHRPQGHLLLRQRQRLRRQHADPAGEVGQRVAFHVYGVDNFFHTFHLHGHRWREPDGRVVDNQHLRPGATPSGSNSPRTTRAAGSTTATSSSTCTRG